MKVTYAQAYVRLCMRQAARNGLLRSGLDGVSCGEVGRASTAALRSRDPAVAAEDGLHLKHSGRDGVFAADWARTGDRWWSFVGDTRDTPSKACENEN